MRYWDSEKKVSRTAKRTTARSRPASTRAKRATRGESTRSSVAGGGSVKPFLRRVYRHQAVVSGPIQKLLLFLVLAGLLYAFVLGDSGAVRIAILRHQRASMDENIAELKHNVALLEREIGRLENDAFYIEKIARERYGYVKEGEQVIKIVPGKGKKKR